jgi:hypothetical protein
MKKTLNKRMRDAGQAVLKQGRQLLERSPAVEARPDTRDEKAFRKGQEALDSAGRAVHEATSQKAMTKAIQLLAVAQKHFDVVFKRQRKG